MAPRKLVGQNYTTPDMVAKVTGRAKYAEDFRAEGMLFAKLLLSPFPHARVVRIDAAAALAMPGVRAMVTADDLPKPAGGVSDLGQAIQVDPNNERALTNEPLYEGEPILAVAAIDEATAAEAIERIVVEFEPLPFVIDPLDSLRPGGPNARTTGNVWIPKPGAANAGPFGTPMTLAELKWTESDFADAGDGRVPLGKPAEEWSFGDVEATFKDAALVLDETFATGNNSHQTLESRSAMAYWENGKLYMHCSTQSTVQTVGAVANWVGIAPEDVVVISEYTGGGFGSKVTSDLSVVIPALLSKKTSAPVMMRISREEEHYIGGARPGFLGRVKAGFARDGRLRGLDLFVISDNGPYELQFDAAISGLIASLLYQPPAMRFRSISVLTNTPPRVSQSQPGGMQAVAIVEPLLTKAARQLGIDQVAIRRINAPTGSAPAGPRGPDGKAGISATSAFPREALDRGAELFNWEQRKQQSGARRGSKVRGVGVGVSAFFAGSSGFDGLLVIKPDGRLYVQSGIGNLGTESVIDVHRVAAELLDVSWEDVEVTWGNTSRHLPWTCISGGSQTTHAMTRAAHAAAVDATRKLQEIAARTFGGSPEAYRVANGRVSGSRGSLTLADAARKAIELGGRYDGHDVPENINAVTKRAAAALAGQGLMGVARDEYPALGQPFSFVAGFAEVEVDTETGQYAILDYLAVADVGTVLHPRSLGGQILGRSMLGIGHTIGQKWVYDKHYGVALAKRFYHNKPPTILDAPLRMQWAALDIPDPGTPVGARGIGEPPVGAGCTAVLNALIDALGEQVIRRIPVNADMILTSLEAGHPAYDPLAADI
jgi:xanthine dehydrogenase molybdenum-binding subunit